MKKFTLKKRDIYDLSSVMASIIKEQSEKLDFKEVIGIQKNINYFLSEITDFSTKLDAITKERGDLVEIANKKITTFRQTLQKNAEKTESMDEKYKEKLDNFVNTVLEDTQGQIENEISPRIEELYSTIGKEEVGLELENDKHKILVDNFEKFAKEKYINKSRMVEVYEILSV